VPGLFGAAVTRDRGVNVMGHNLDGRDVAHDGERWTVDGEPLRFFHFASIDPRRPDRLGSSREDSWSDVDGRPGVAALLATYVERLRSRGWTAERPAAGFTALPSGLAITPAMRRAYLDALVAAEHDGGAPPPNPLLGDDEDAFLAWLARPAPGIEHPWLSRYLLATSHVRDDLRRTWPAVPGVHTEPFLAWCYADLGAQDPAWEHVDARR
jgi:hypothetical protein